MNSRDKKQHVEAMDRLSSIKYAMANPSADGIKALQKAVQFIKKQYEPKSFAETKTVPQIDLQYINGFITSLSFNVTDFGQKLDEIDNPKKFARQLEFGAPIRVIKDIMSAPRISTDELAEDEKKRWTAMLNMKMNLDPISNLLNKMSSKDVKTVQISTRVLALVTLVIGTILTNYILLIIAVGLIAADISIDKYLEESIQLDSQKSVLETKKLPYFLSGVYPLIHVDREKEHKDITFNQNSAFAANNLIELINKIHAYIDILDVYGKSKSSQRDRFPIEHLRVAIQTMWSNSSPTNDNTMWVRATKDKILSMSRMCCTENFVMEPAEQVSFLNEFLWRIESACRELAGTRDGLTNDMTPVELVPMFETFFLQVWDAFLTQNKIKKTVSQVNQYISIDLNDDTPDIMMYYNSLQPLDYGRKAPDANDIISNIFESIGSKVPSHLLTEGAITQDPSKIIDEKVSACLKNIHWHKEKRDGSRGVKEAIKWEAKSGDEVKERIKHVTKEEAECTQFSMNAANVASSLLLLNSIQTYLTTDYFKDRANAPDHINDLIAKAFPGAGITDSTKHFSGEHLSNIIGSGSRSTIPKKKMSGAELQKFITNAIPYFADTKVSEYWDSDIYEKLEKMISSFKTNATNANRKPILKTEGIDDDESILNMFEAEGDPPVIERTKIPVDPNRTPSPGTTVGGDPKDQGPVVANQSAVKDMAVITHAVDVINCVLNIIYKMTAYPHMIVQQCWQSLGVNMSNNPQQNAADDSNQPQQ